MSVLRATFEAVYSAQEKLRKHLDTLIEENRPLQSSNERDLFMKELSYATLGLGNEKIVLLKSNLGALIRTDIETYARWLSYRDTKTPHVPFVINQDEGDEKNKLDICILWKTLRDNLFSVFPLALKHSASMSREQDASAKIKGHDIGGINSE